MSKIDFKNLVSGILVEAEPNQDQNTNTANVQIPSWLQQIINKHKELFDKEITDADMQTLFSIVQKPNVSEQDALNNIGVIRILDVLQQLYNQSPKPKPTTWTEFKNKLSGKEFEMRGIEILNRVKTLTPEQRAQWPVEDGEVLKAWNMAQAAGDKLAAIALNNFNNKSVLETVQGIINNRINVFTRVAKLKNPKTPFTNLITDIFKQPEPYLSGQKKYSSDFEAVDDLYIKDIIKIAIAAKEFYAAEITKLKLQQPVQDSINGFSNLISLLLGEETVGSSSSYRSGFENINWSGQKQKQGMSQAEKQAQANRIRANVGKTRAGTQSSKFGQQQQQQDQPQQIDKKIQEQIRQKALEDITNRINFLQGKPIQYSIVDTEGKDTDNIQTTDPKQYIIGNIQKMETTEAQNLIRALQAIALYTKKKPGAGEITKNLAGAIGSLRVGMGPVN